MATQKIKVPHFSEEDMDYLREHYEWGDVWFYEASLTLAHIEMTRRTCNILTHSTNEAPSDFDERMKALQRLDSLEAEAKRIFKRVKRKRARKRGAAIRHRVNAVFNTFNAKVMRGLMDDVMTVLNKQARDEMFQSNYFVPHEGQSSFYDSLREGREVVIGVDYGYGRPTVVLYPNSVLDIWDYRKDPPGPVVHDPHTIVTTDLSDEEGDDDT